MDFILKPFESAIAVTKLAYLHYFDFTEDYHALPDKHTFCELVYVDSGKLNITSARYDGALLPKQMILHLAGDEHALSASASVPPEVIIIGFACACDKDLLLPFSKSPVNLDRDAQNLLAQIIREGFSVYAPPYDVPNVTDMKKRENAPFGADQMIRTLLEQFLIRLVRATDEQVSPATPQQERKSLVDDAKRYIKENLTSHVSVGELCLIFNTNKTTLHRAFKEQTGDTVVHYINRRRTRLAKQLIATGDKTMTEIADTLGFSSVHYFSRTFTQYEGLSPTAYARTLTNEKN